ALSDRGAVLAETVIVADDGARTDVGAGADMRVADIAEVIDLDARLQRCRLGLDEIADFSPLPERSPRAHPRVGANGCILADRGLHDMAKRMDHGAVGDGDAGTDHHKRFDRDVIAE